jgi:hypothetical protein
MCVCVCAAASQESSQCGAAEVVDVGIVAGDALFPRHTSVSFSYRVITSS